MWVAKQQASKVQAQNVVQAPVVSRASRVCMYSEPPDEQISIEDFEGFALDRLKGILFCIGTLSWESCMSASVL